MSLFTPTNYSSDYSSWVYNGNVYNRLEFVFEAALLYVLVLNSSHGDYNKASCGLVIKYSIVRRSVDNYNVGIFCLYGAFFFFD